MDKCLSSCLISSVSEKREGIARIIEIQSPQIRGVKGENMEIKGIDVSSWQGKIDWNKVANYGMDFAILRITEAGNVIDGQFENNFAGCNKYKIPVGVYKYSYASTVSEARSEARKVVSVLNGRKIQFPVFLDLENQIGRAHV